jgi:hypothetical protein
MLAKHYTAKWHTMSLPGNPTVSAARHVLRLCSVICSDSSMAPNVWDVEHINKLEKIGANKWKVQCLYCTHEFTANTYKVTSHLQQEMDNWNAAPAHLLSAGASNRMPPPPSKNSIENAFDRCRTSWMFDHYKVTIFEGWVDAAHNPLLYILAVNPKGIK